MVRGRRQGNVVLNGKKIDGVKISHEDIMRGGLLEFFISGGANENKVRNNSRGDDSCRSG